MGYFEDVLRTFEATSTPTRYLNLQTRALKASYNPSTAGFCGAATRLIERLLSGKRSTAWAPQRTR